MNWLYTGDSPVPSSLEPWKEKNRPHEGGKEKQETHMQAFKLQVSGNQAESGHLKHREGVIWEETAQVKGGIKIQARLLIG